jgi:hypothetical protein
MNLHANAQTCPHCRFLIVSRVVDGQMVASVAREFRVASSVRSAKTDAPHNQIHNQSRNAGPFGTARNYRFIVVGAQGFEPWTR